MKILITALFSFVITGFASPVICIPGRMVPPESLTSGCIVVNAMFSNLTDPSTVNDPTDLPAVTLDVDMENPIATAPHEVFGSGIDPTITNGVPLNTSSGALPSQTADPIALVPPSLATPEIGSLTMIGSGLVFLSLVASSTRRRKRAKIDVHNSERS